MGPTILLDKSALQSFSAEELFFLHRYYFLNITPILIQEIQGDLQKRKDEKASIYETKILAQKISSTGSFVCAPYQTMILEELLYGNIIPMNGRIPIDNESFQARDANGEIGIVFNEHPARATLRRWSRGDFSGKEKSKAMQWRTAACSIDLEKISKIMKANLVDLPTFKNLDELLLFVDEFINALGIQNVHLKLIMEKIGAFEKTKKLVYQKWMYNKYPKLIEFAPCAYHCLRIDYCFLMGLQSGMISTKRTNILDIEIFILSAILPGIFI